MRSIVSVFVLLASSMAASTASSAPPEWVPGGTLQFETGGTYNLSLTFPALPDWDSLTANVSLSTAVFEPLAASSFSTGYSVFGGLSVVDLGPSATYVGKNTFQVLMPLAAPTAVASGALVLTMALQVKPNLDAPLLGNQQVVSDIEYTTFAMEGDEAFRAPLTINANIVAIPEPHIWASMLIGLAVVGGVLGRTRSKAASRAG